MPSLDTSVQEPPFFAVEAASHVPQLEGPATKIYNYVWGRFAEIKQKKKKRLETVLSSSGQPLKKKKKDSRCIFKNVKWKKEKKPK